MSKIRGILGAYAMTMMASEILQNKPEVKLIDTNEDLPSKYPKNRNNDPYDKDLMLAEYAKIQKKESNLSANKRKFIVLYCERYYSEETKNLTSK